MKLPFTLRDRPSQANFDKIAAALGEQTFKAPLPFGSGWGNYGGGWEAGSYSRIGRLVVLQGLVTKAGGIPTVPDLIGTLPVGSRPSDFHIFATWTGEPNQPARIEVTSAGQIQWKGGGTGETDFTTLSGIVFVAA
jgi:hypothetical protein